MREINAGKEICPFLEKKVTLFNRYLSITKRMKETLRGKEAGNPGVFISKRQDCINKIEQIDSSIEKIIKPSADRLSQISDQVNTPTLPSPFKGEGLGGGEGLIQSYLSSIKTIMEKVDLMDRELLVMVKEEGEGIKNELLRMRNVRQVSQGYKKEKRYSPRFLDTVK